MEPEGSLPHSQVPATCPCPEPARSSPYPHILLLAGTQTVRFRTPAYKFENPYPTQWESEMLSLGVESE
jgi:transposase